MLTESTITNARITSAMQGMFNPVSNLTPSTLVSQINNWKTGYLSSLAYTFEAIEERDYQIRADSPKRYKSVSRIPWEVAIIAGHQDNPVALRHKSELEFFYNNLTATEALEANVRGGFSMLVRQMARAVGHRYSAHEIVFNPASPRWSKTGSLESGLSATFTWLPLYFFESTKGRLRYIEQPYGLEGVEMPRGEWLVTVGDGLLLASAICWMYKTIALKDWVSYNGKFGLPGIHGKTEAAKNSDEWNDFVEAVKDFANDWYAVTNKSGEISILTANGGATVPMKELLQKMDDAITRMWRGGDSATQTSQPGGEGVSNQSDEKNILLEGDIEVVNETLQQQVDPFVINWYEGDGTKPLAYVRLKRPDQKIVTQELAVDAGLKALGIDQDPQSLAERYGRTIAKVKEPIPTAANVAQSTDSDRLAVAIRTDLAPFRAKYGPLLDKLAAALALEDEALAKAEIDALRPELEAMLADREIFKAVLANTNAADLLEGILGREFLNTLSKSKETK